MDPTSDSQPRTHFIYAITLSDTPYIHVHHTTVDRVGRFYTKCIGGKLGATKPMAEMALKEGRNLSLFLLEKYSTCNNADAYHRCIAWQQLAVQAGYTPQSVADRRHLEHMNDAECMHYTELRNHNIRALCSSERDLVPGILARRRGARNNSSHRSVRVIMPCKTHRALSTRARAHGLTLPEYLVTCATDASPGVDLSEIIAVRSEIQQALSLLCSTVVRPELTSTDIRALFEASRTISAALSTVTQCLTTLASTR